MTNYDAVLNFIDCHHDVLETLKGVGGSDAKAGMNVQVDAIKREVKHAIE